jgi:hypothetical protein
LRIVSPFEMARLVGRLILVLSMLLILAPALITDPSQWPGFSNLADCAQASIVGCYGCYTGVLGFGIDCSTWVCACDHFSAAMSVVSSVAVSRCTDSQDVAEATSVWNGFCAQLSAIPTGPTGPTQTGMQSPPHSNQHVFNRSKLGVAQPTTAFSNGGPSSTTPSSPREFLSPLILVSALAILLPLALHHFVH